MKQIIKKQEQGIEFVRVKPIQKEIYEIKTNELRSLFKYQAGKIIVVGVVFVKDAEGYVFKKLESEISSDEKIISEKEFMKVSGLASYEKKFGHGGARKNAGRKQKFGSPLKFQIRVTKEEKDFLTYAREHKLNYSALMQM